MNKFKRKVAILFGVYIASCITAFVTSFGSMFFCICAAVNAIDRSTATILAVASVVLCILFCVISSSLENHAEKMYRRIRNNKEKCVKIK